MTTRTVLSATLAFLFLTASARGETAAIFKMPPAPDPMKPWLLPSHRPPTGVPGFYDPATSTFTPLQLSPSATVFSGFIHVNVSYNFDRSDKGTDSVFCDVRVEFGVLNDQGDVLSIQFDIQQSFNFSVSNPQNVFSAPFDTDWTFVKVSLTCRLQSGGQIRATDDDIIVQSVTNGNLNVHAIIDL